MKKYYTLSVLLNDIENLENGETIYISKSLELDANRLDNNVFRETKETLKRKNIKIKIIPSKLF